MNRVESLTRRLRRKLPFKLLVKNEGEYSGLIVGIVCFQARKQVTTTAFEKSKKLDFPETGKFVMTLECQGFSESRWRLVGKSGAQPYHR